MTDEYLVLCGAPKTHKITVWLFLSLKVFFFLKMSFHAILFFQKNREKFEETEFRYHLIKL